MKRRPVCVVSSLVYNKGPDVIVAMVTSSQIRLAQLGLGDVLLQEWQQASLHQPSVVRAGRLLVIEHRLLSGGLGQLSQPDLAAVDVALKAALGLS
jgi:mRNA-degrading endonuclease toxin of MazEF toxin-antitoxin module